jgi:hypothetical protein
MRALIKAVGQQRVAERMMWVQYLGYQSLEWCPFPAPLPSQRFAFRLVRDALAAGKLIIVGRSRKLWTEAVPELATYHYIELSSPRSPYLTPNNMGDAEFARVIDALRD